MNPHIHNWKVTDEYHYFNPLGSRLYTVVCYECRSFSKIVFKAIPFEDLA